MQNYVDDSIDARSNLVPLAEAPLGKDSNRPCPAIWTVDPNLHVAELIRSLEMGLRSIGTSQRVSKEQFQ